MSNKFIPEFHTFRFYEDGTESGSSPIAGIDTNVTGRDVNSDSQIQLRVGIQEVGGGSVGGETTDDYQLEWRLNGGGGFSSVTAASSNVQADTGSTLSDGSATTDRATNGITDGGGSFVAGEQEAANGLIEDSQLTADNFTEHVYALLLISADLSDTDFLEFRVISPANSVTNSVVPTITVTKAGGDQTVLPGAGVLTLTGFAPTLVIAADQIVTPNKADLTLAGQAPYSFLPNTFPYFDGTNDWLDSLSSGALTNNNVGLASIWCKPDSGDNVADNSYLIASSNQYVMVFVATSAVAGRYNIRLKVREDGTGTILLDVTSNDDCLIGGQANHILISWDLATSTYVGRCNDAAISWGTPSSGPTDGIIDWNRGPFAMGAFPTGTAKFTGGIQELYLTNEFLDITSSTNYRKFISTDGRPVSLGADGSIPTGTAAAIYCRSVYSSFETNSGSLGDFTVNGTLTDEGTVPRLSQGLTASPAAAALTLTGFAPTLVQTDDKFVLPAQADLSLGGFAPTVDVAADITIPVANAALVLEGLAPTLVKTDNKIVQPSQADLALTGFAPTIDLTLDLIVRPGAGALILTGFVPVVDVAADKIVQPGQADLTLTGFAPVLVQTDDKIVQPAQADLSLEGFAPTANLGADITIQVPQADLALEGFVPTVQRADDHLIAVPNADLALEGFVPIINRTDDKTVLPVNADLVLEGFAPSITTDGSITIDVPAGALALEGFAPTIDLPSLAGVAKHTQGTLVGLKHMMGM